MPARKSALSSLTESPVAWVAIVLGALGLFVYFSRQRGGNASRGNRRLNTRGGATATNLTQILQEKHYAGWKVCICVECFGTVDPATQTFHPSKNAKSIEVLKHLVATTELIIFCRTTPPSSAKLIDGILECIGPVVPMASNTAKTVPSSSTPPSFPRHKILLCSTEKGYEAFARQLMPTLFLTKNIPLANFLVQFLPYIVVLQGGGEDACTTPREEGAASETKKLKQASNMISLGILADGFNV